MFKKFDRPIRGLVGFVAGCNTMEGAGQGHQARRAEDRGFRAKKAQGQQLAHPAQKTPFSRFTARASPAPCF